MVLEDLNPAVRVEEILDGADIEPATRLEYFMKKAANEVPKPAGSSDAGKVVTVNEDGDGYELGEIPSGLPEYTSADKGKFLGLGEADPSVTPSVQTVIVPEQEVTITDHGDGEVAMYFGYLSNFDFSSLVDGNEAVFNINGVEYLGECLDSAVYFNVPDHGSYYVEDDGKFEWYESAVLTVSATASVAALEPKWIPFGGVYTLSSNAENTLLSLLQSAITTAATGGSARVEITTGFDSDDLAMIEKMADDFSSGSPCVLSIFAITNALSPIASSTSDTISNKFVTFNIPVYSTANMYFNIIFTLKAGDNLFGTVTVIKLAIT